MSRNWVIKTPHPQLQHQISEALKIHPIVAQVLINRDVMDIAQAQSFLRADLKCLHDPFLLRDMNLAIERIRKAARAKEGVLIFGDYDVDGVTSSALLRKTLERIGLEVEHYIPHRLKEGYGLNHNVIEEAQQKQVGLLIAVDCGINAFDEVKAIAAAGMDVMIIDHHEPSHGRLPEAMAIINPKRHDCSYPFKGLASVGLVFKLMQALLGDILDEALELAALGTISDVAELTGENRILAKEGLERLRSTKNVGLRALMEVARLKDQKISAKSVGFVLGPRINATGRLSSAEESLNLLLSENMQEASLLAKGLEDLNQQRQRIQSIIFSEALSIVEREVNFHEHRVIVVSGDGWHKGVLGIVAARLLEMYYRPTIVISCEDGLCSGSARSIDGFHLFEALTHCEAFLENFGGHQHAAGLTIKKENIAAFCEVINAYAQRVIRPEHLIPTLELDAEIQLSNLDCELVQIMEQIEPHGEGNPVPQFCSRKLKIKGAPVVLGRDTLKFWVSDGQLTVLAVGFGMAKFKDLLVQAREVDLAFSPEIDDWNKESTVQLRVKDIKTR